MDRAFVISYLQAVEDHVANGEQQLANQSNRISSLERTGRDTTSAIALLRGMQQRQMQRIADREWLRAELAALDVKAGETEAHASR
jgi:TolA-binding protein